MILYKIRVLYSRTVLFTYFIYSRLYLLIPNNEFKIFMLISSSHVYRKSSFAWKKKFLLLKALIEIKVSFLESFDWKKKSFFSWKPCSEIVFTKGKESLTHDRILGLGSHIMKITTLTSLHPSDGAWRDGARSTWVSLNSLQLLSAKGIYCLFPVSHIPVVSLASITT